MGTTTDLETLADFFGRYGSALTTGDLPALASCYRLPGTVVADGYSFTFSTPAAVALSFLGAAPAYQECRLVAAHAEIEHLERLSERLVMVTVRWEYLDSRGEAVPGGGYRYIIRLDGRPQICVVMPLG